MSLLTEINRKRDKFLSANVKRLKGAYNRYDEYLFERFKGLTSYDQALLLLQLINTTDAFIPELTILYKQVVVFFGLDTYKQFKKSEPTVSTFERYATDYLDIYGGLKIVSIQDSRKLLVGNLLSQYRQEGYTIFEAFTELKKALKLDTLWQAERIARTEILAASNWGQWKGAKETGFNMMKSWVPRLDNRVRVPHSQMINHPDIPINDTFIVDGVEMLYPGDWNGGASNVISCRCAVKYYVQ